jgi:MazG family protein
MPLLVVPLAAEHVGALTLGELDKLVACERVMFEDPFHPLVARLKAMGVEAGAFDDEPDATRSGWALVADPHSARVIDLARSGAEVTSGAATPPDSLTAARGAPDLRESAAALSNAVLIMSRLRSDDGCPWDREQTHESLKVHLLEEAYEVIDAIDAGKTGADLEEELGDLLLQVLFHARIADQDGRFAIASVADGLVTKLVRRHPHVFGETAVDDSGEVVANWERIKREEKSSPRGERGPWADIPSALPALLAAYKMQKRAAGLGFEADEGVARSEVAGALAAGDEASVGRALFWLVALCRARGVDPEGALRRELSEWRRSFETRTSEGQS